MFESAYEITGFYCMPGKESAREKGGVEGEGGRFRLRWFVPVPKIADVAGLAGACDVFGAFGTEFTGPCSSSAPTAASRARRGEDPSRPRDQVAFDPIQQDRWRAPWP
ncbi:hypothetical protein [Amycolatopsis sp. FDAARGOS 1241]|uniref:hypothetical protein n=1 Tax=Amycolatopsis sp. FDAARGOS 1241 TaxID=2778070 RepID=UPI00194FF479|nr:hypothetical protein [Amycolatopsis sp. FDAARGOS 1241]QRP47892.1 hypothetical protein I6J71_08270 [Amycolatopsis sp. FDAARGOS 1241]